MTIRTEHVQPDARKTREEEKHAMRVRHMQIPAMRSINLTVDVEFALYGILSALRMMPAGRSAEHARAELQFHARCLQMDLRAMAEADGKPWPYMLRYGEGTGPQFMSDGTPSPAPASQRAAE